MIAPLRKFRHYKGGDYLLLGTATHEPTGELMVIYQGIADGKVWVRPHSNFYEGVPVDGARVPRFKEIK